YSWQVGKCPDTSGDPQLAQLFVDLGRRCRRHGLIRRTGGAGSGWAHERLRSRLAGPELNESPVGRVAAREPRISPLLQRPSTAAYADSHHHAAGLPLAPTSTARNGDVLPNLLAGLRVVNRLRIAPGRVPDHVRSLAQCAAHGVISNTLRQQLQLALDLGQSLHVDANVHASTPAPTTCPMPMAEARRGNTRSGNPP